jgi:hypothetical protein
MLKAYQYAFNILSVCINVLYFKLAGNFGITEELPDDDALRRRNVLELLDTIKY